MHRRKGGNVCACLRVHVDTKRGRAASSSTHLPRGYWHDKANQRDFLDQVAKELGIKEVLNFKIALNHLTTPSSSQTGTKYHDSR